ncbi:hypothetical protein CVT24_009147 [Panaeolus cyanescens]|uniref:Uncharacterized protein n=1 Tax=Panaeolus cyanescens TaxID=181874 RepID=A0A409WCS9_9AGAR|nr:hypothetical protein CVT24_009147 [Panaeolus cyanescens]
MSCSMKNANSLILHRAENSKSCNSILTFAVIWDPERGLETFSGGELEDHVARLNTPKQSTSGNGGDFDSLEYSDSDGEDTPIVSQKQEPFAVFGSRGPHFIDIRSSSAYERCILDPEFTDDADKSPHTGKTLPTPPARDCAAPTPRASRQSRSSHSPSQTHTAAKIGRPRVSRADSGVDLTYSLYKPRECSVDQQAQSRASSSPRRPPRSSRPPVERRPVSHSEHNFAQHDKTLHKLYDVDHLYLTQGAIHYNECLESSEEESDEGFYDSSPLPMEEQHLPSCFSVTTTSTSTFVSVNRRDVPSPTPRHQNGIFAAQQDCQPVRRSTKLPSLGSRLTTIKPTATSTEVNRVAPVRRSSYEEQVSRFSKAIKSHLPKRLIHHDDGWVFVDVQSVVVDKVMNV